jgi:hypothetical protein
MEKKVVSYENVVVGRLKLKGDKPKNGIKKNKKIQEESEKEKVIKTIVEIKTKTETEIAFEKVQKERVNYI